MVAIGHLYGIDQRFFGPPILPAAIQLGFAGVDLFFVLSGFVIVYLTRPAVGQAAAIPAFLFARFGRIYPLWWLVLGAVIAVWLVRPEWVFASVEGQPNLLADLALLPHDRLPLLAVGWTLIHELYFYLAFALLLFLPRGLFPSGLLGWLVLVAGANAWLLALDVPVGPLLGLLTHPLTLEFGMGAFVGLLACRGYRPAPRLLLLAGCVGLLFGAGAWAGNPPGLFDNDWLRTLILGPAWAAIVWGAVGLEVEEGQGAPRVLVGLGDASYALYLIHVSVFAVVARVFSRFASESPLDNAMAAVASLAAAILAALILHRLFDAPVQRLLAQARHALFPQGSRLLPSPPLPLLKRTGR